jgi:hypothetical protein
MATNLGGIAKDAPAPTPPDQLEAALRASLKAKPKPGLGAHRADVGSARAAGTNDPLMRELARSEGPIAGEMLGEASPILPKKVLADIVEKMKSLPMSEREAYVARAKDIKTRAQVENVRRVLEQLGLLLPVGVAAGTLSEQR